MHCNVWSKFKNSTIIHLAKRSRKLNNFPGLYDNLIAGGQPIDLSIKNNFYKEAFEEAGLSQEQSSHAKKVILSIINTMKTQISIQQLYLTII